MALVESLYPLHRAVQTLLRKIDDTCFAAGSEAYVAALLVYQYAKVPQRRHRGAGRPLGRRFARKARKAAAPA